MNRIISWLKRHHIWHSWTEWQPVTGTWGRGTSRGTYQFRACTWCGLRKVKGLW